ncbi:HET-domain-containing protein [Zalerion maritima]|uniref:HET-domain-containing protein n=1 Tax=Zalerion maritima TaxID=339359 RepID=A0AAD5RRY5_9PEZI|nr:HET-domain-containing protein [Zalerion maritima]
MADPYPFLSDGGDFNSIPDISSTLCPTCLSGFEHDAEENHWPDLYYATAAQLDSSDTTSGQKHPPCGLCTFLSSCLSREVSLQPSVAARIEQEQGLPLSDLIMVDGMTNFSDTTLASTGGTTGGSGTQRSRAGKAPLYNFVYTKSVYRLTFGSYIVGSGPAATGVFDVYARLLDAEKVEFGLLRSWLDYCAENHAGGCRSTPPASSLSSGGQQQKPEQEELGIHVIDCTTRDITPYTTSMGPFVTLSYIWGVSPSETNYAQPQSPTLPSEVPKVIDDAMEVVRRLRMRYLWVDRYCIPQDNPEEKARQVGIMAGIYSTSFLTIIAAAGEGPEFGLPGVGSRKRLPQLRCRVGGRVFVRAGSGNRLALQGKWNSRGWTFQEGLLSTRRLVFTVEEVYFQCRSVQSLESIVTPPERKYDRIDLGAGDTGWNFFEQGLGIMPLFEDVETEHFEKRKIHGIVSEFFYRDLSWESDAVNACFGLLQRMKSMDPPVHSLCGLPVHDERWLVPPNHRKLMTGNDPLRPTALLVMALGWDTIRDDADTPLVRRMCFPSWSWVGWKSSSWPAAKKGMLSFPCYDFLRGINWKGPRTGFFDPLANGLVPRVEVVAEYSAGDKAEGEKQQEGKREVVQLEWDKDWEMALDMSHQDGKFPSALVISGFMLSVGFRRNPNAEGKWEFSRDIPLGKKGATQTRPEERLGRRIESLRRAGVELAKRGDDEEVEIAVLLMHDFQEMHYFSFLARVECIGSGREPCGNEYQRVGGQLIDVGPFEPESDPDNAREGSRKKAKLGPLELEMGEVRVV